MADTFVLRIYDANGQLKTAGVNSINFTATPTGVFDATASVTAGVATVALAMDNQATNLVLASPNGSTGQPAFRSLVSDDIPNLDAAKITSGTVAAARMPAFTGDVTTSAGSTATTLATVNGDVGTFALASITANAKGLITAAAAASTTGSGSVVLSGSPTITTPTIASFTNATHNHTNAAGGGQITDAALSAAVGVAKGGLGITTTPSNGQIPIGNGTNYTAANITSSTTNVTVTNGAGTISLSSNSAWAELVANTFLGSDSTIDLTSISGSYAHLVLMVELRSDRAGANSDNVYIRLNNDSTAGNYYGNSITITSAVGNTERLGATATGFEVRSGATAATSPTDYGSIWTLWIYNYAVTSRPRHVFWNGYTAAADSTGGLATLQGGGTWKNTSAAVNRITLVPVNGTNFKQTVSSYALFGVGKV